MLRIVRHELVNRQVIFTHFIMIMRKNKKNNKLSFLRSSQGRSKRFFLSLFFLFFVLGTLFAQYEYLAEFENLYPGCEDNEESIIFGGSYPNKWPKGLNLPVFPGGGDIQLTRYVNSNIDYPDVVDFATRERAKGVVRVEVVIDRCGRATRQRLIESVDHLYDMEALRIMENLPVFKPGALDGERVKVALTIPVYFTRNTLPKKKHVEEYNYEDYDW